jgi:hypothetical protein
MFIRLLDLAKSNNDINSKKIICLDGDLGNRTKKILSAFGNNRMIENVIKKDTNHFLFTPDELTFNENIDKAIKENKNIVIVSMSDTKAKFYFDKYSKEGRRAILYTSSSSDNDKKLLAQVEKIWTQHQIIIYSPSIESGVDFNVDDYIDIGTQEMLHDWKEGTSIYPHIHVALDGANASGSSQYAKFTIYMAYADENNVYTETSKNIELEIPDGTANLTHLFANSTTIDFSGLTIGTQMNVRLKRIAATSGTEYPNHIFVTQIGIHYEINTLGSRQIGVK